MWIYIKGFSLSLMGAIVSAIAFILTLDVYTDDITRYYFGADPIIGIFVLFFGFVFILSIVGLVALTIDLFRKSPRKL